MKQATPMLAAFALGVLLLTGVFLLVFRAQTQPDPIENYIKPFVVPTRVGPEVREALLTRTPPPLSESVGVAIEYLMLADWSGSPRTPTDAEVEYLFTVCVDHRSADVRTTALMALNEMNDAGLIAPGTDLHTRYMDTLTGAVVVDESPAVNADAASRLIILGALDDPDLKAVIEFYFQNADESDVPYADGPAFRLIERSPEDFEALAVPLLPEDVIERLRSQTPPTGN